MIIEFEKPSTLYDKMFIEALKNRRLILNDEIDGTLIDIINMSIKSFNEEDKDIAIEARKPIEIYIHSFGGEVYGGFGICNSILTSKTPVHTYCEGAVMSMGLAIFTCGHKRFSYPLSNFMYHEVSGGVAGKNLEIERATVENKRLMKMYDSIVIKNTNVDQKKLDAVKKKSLDWFFDSYEAKNLGFVHEIIE